MKRKSNSGFTITELIIVIAVLAVLSAVLIPTVTGYLKKAKVYNDISTATQMSKYISYYLTSDDANQIDTNDVQTIYEALYQISSGQVVKKVDGKYKLIECESAQYGYNFWFNTKKKCVELVNDNDYIDINLKELSNNEQQIDSLESFAWNEKFPYILLSTDGSLIANYLSNIKNSKNIKSLKVIVDSLEEENSLLVKRLRKRLDDFVFVTPEITDNTNVIVLNQKSNKVKKLSYTFDSNGEYAKQIKTNGDELLAGIKFDQIIIKESIENVSFGAFYNCDIEEIIIENEEINSIDKLANILSFYSFNDKTLIKTIDNKYYIKDDLYIVDFDDKEKVMLKMNIFESNHLSEIINTYNFLKEEDIKSNIFNSIISENIGKTILESVIHLENTINALSSCEMKLYEKADILCLKNNVIEQICPEQSSLSGIKENIEEYILLKNNGLQAIDNLIKAINSKYIDDSTINGTIDVATISLENLVESDKLFGFEIKDLVFVQTNSTCLKKVEDKMTYLFNEIGQDKITIYTKILMDQNELNYNKELCTINVGCYPPIETLSLQLVESKELINEFVIKIDFKYSDNISDDIVANIKSRISLSAHNENGYNIITQSDYLLYDEYNIETQEGSFMINLKFIDDFKTANVRIVLDGYDVMSQILTIGNNH